MQNETVKLTIDSQEIEVAAGSTILDAANLLGIEIPTLCLPPEGTKARAAHRPSCMICVVEIIGRNSLVPSCSALAEDGIEVITNSETVIKSRRCSVEMLLSEHLGECEAPCQIACPIGWNIPQFMAALGGNKNSISKDAANMLAKQLPLAGLLGKLCHNPCQNACRIKQLGGDPIQIKKLHLFTANSRQPFVSNNPAHSNCNIAVIGSGPSALAAASTVIAAEIGCTVYESLAKPGGSLNESVNQGEISEDILQNEIDFLQKSGVKFQCETTIDIATQIENLLKDFSAVIIACGSEVEANILKLPRVFAAGKADAKLARQNRLVHIAASGKKAAMAAIAAARGITHTQLTQTLVRYGDLTEDEQQKIFGRIDKYATFDELTAQSEKISAEADRCLVCGCKSADDCRLREIAALTGAKTNRFTGARREVDVDSSHENIVMEPHKCILCGACGAESTQNNEDKSNLAIIGRGIHCNISSVCGKLSDQCGKAQASALAEICPTAAIHKK